MRNPQEQGKNSNNKTTLVIRISTDATMLFENNTDRNTSSGC